MDRNALAELLQALESRRDAEERRREERYTALIERLFVGSAPRYHPRSDSGAAKTNTLCPPKRVPSADRFFSLCRPAMLPPQSCSVGGQRSSRQLTGEPAGARPDYRGRWCAVSQGHTGPPKPGGARPIVRRPLGTLVHSRHSSLDSYRRCPGYRAHPALHEERLYQMHHSGAQLISFNTI
ncbi:UNVERIFIED_CONTAM: hypothetical protein FKN15_007887 [Acipenser sinensis]